MSQTLRGQTLFDEIYHQPDPRAFYGRLGRLDYQIPHHAQPVVRRLVAARTRSGPVTVLDLRCCYRINAALLNHHLTLDDLYTHLQRTGGGRADDRRADPPGPRVLRRPPPCGRGAVVGLDIAAAAIDFARAVGLIDAGFAENLETGPASAALRQAAATAWPALRE